MASSHHCMTSRNWFSVQRESSLPPSPWETRKTNHYRQPLYQVSSATFIHIRLSVHSLPRTNTTKHGPAQPSTIQNSPTLTSPTSINTDQHYQEWTNTDHHWPILPCTAQPPPPNTSQHWPNTDHHCPKLEGLGGCAARCYCKTNTGTGRQSGRPKSSIWCRLNASPMYLSLSVLQTQRGGGGIQHEKTKLFK